METVEDLPDNSVQSVAFPTSSAPLWSHLISRTTKPKGSKTTVDTAQAPIAPVDKIGTSARLLLHDTQLQLEKFSKRTDALHDSITSSRQELQDVCALSRESTNAIENTITDLVNRCQTQLQKKLGEPAQEHTLESLRASQSSIETSTHELSRRIDILQMSSQTHSQALQSIQDLLNQIITVVCPLLPLVQALPERIDHVKTSVEAYTKESVESMKADSKPCQCHHRDRSLSPVPTGHAPLNNARGVTPTSQKTLSSPLTRKALHINAEKEGTLSKVDICHTHMNTPRKLSLCISPARQRLGNLNSTSSRRHHSPSRSSSRIHPYRSLLTETPTGISGTQHQKSAASVARNFHSLAASVQSPEMPLMKAMRDKDTLSRSMTSTHGNMTTRRDHVRAIDTSDHNFVAQHHPSNQNSNQMSNAYISRADTQIMPILLTNRTPSTFPSHVPTPILLSDNTRDTKHIAVTRSSTPLAPSNTNSIVPATYPPPPDKPLTLRQLRATSTVGNLWAIHRKGRSGQLNSTLYYTSLTRASDSYLSTTTMEMKAKAERCMLSRVLQIINNTLSTCSECPE